jgi:membrane protein implicated in regulation of membrane protease activity
MLLVSWLIPFGAIMFAVMAFVVVRFVLMGWRFLRGDEEMEPGGSYGRQLFGRRKNRNAV